MRLVNRIYNRCCRKKPKISPEKWARVTLDQLFSEKWNKFQKELYTSMKKYMSEIPVSEQFFLAEILGAQLELLSLVSIHTNFNLGITITILFREYLKKLPLPIQERIKEAYGYYNFMVGEYGKKGLSGCDAIANACAVRLGLEAYSDFSRSLTVELTALGEVWRNDAKQYRFKKNI